MNTNEHFNARSAIAFLEKTAKQFTSTSIAVLLQMISCAVISLLIIAVRNFQGFSDRSFV